MNPNKHHPSVFRQQLAIVACYASLFMVGVAISLLGPSLPALAERTHISLSQAGLFFTFFSAGSVAATLVVARLNDRPIRRFVLIAGALFMALGCWLLAGSTTFVSAGLAVALTGLAMSAVGTGPNAIVADLYRGRAGQALNALHIAAGLGVFAGPLLLSLVLRLGGDYRIVYRLAAALMLALAALWTLSQPPQPQREASAPQRSLAWLAPLLLIFALAALYTGTEVTFGGWVSTYARTAIAQEAVGASLAASLLWLAVLLGRLAAVRVLRRISNLGLLRYCVLGGAAGLVLILLGQTWGLLFWVGVTVVGFCFGPIFPTALALSSELAPGQAGAVSSLVVASGSMGAMVLPWAAGALMPHIGIAGSMTTAFVPLGFMLICLVAIGRRRP